MGTYSEPDSDELVDWSCFMEGSICIPEVDRVSQGCGVDPVPGDVVLIDKSITCDSAVNKRESCD